MAEEVRNGLRDGVRFLLGHEPRHLTHVDPTRTVLELLRLDERRTGTKEGCAEGDCGACTVILGRPVDGPDGPRMAYRAVNACILFVPMLDGCQLLTVEDLRSLDGGPHPVQRMVVDLHATQCGFCTPGFVAALWTQWRRGRKATLDEADELLAGNLCRCTGYGALREAAMRVGEGGAVEDAVTSREPQTLATLRAWAAEPGFAIGEGSRRFFAPASVREAAELAAAHPDATILGGATDVGLWVTKQDRPIATLIWLGRCAELLRIDETPEGVRIGAAVAYSDAVDALTSLWPDADELLRRLGSVQVRNQGTIGGNVANGSPIGDMPPLLIALGATLTLRHGEVQRRLPIEDFFLAYGRQDRRPGELVEAIDVPRPRPDAVRRCYKISKRRDQDISAVCGAFHLEIEGGRVAAARIAFGGMAAVPKRARAVEAALLNRPFDEATVRGAMERMDEDFTPIGDMRASALYRLTVARNLLIKCWMESGGSSVRVARGEPCPA